MTSPPPPNTPPQPTPRDRKLQALTATNARLSSEFATLQSAHEEAVKKLTNPQAKGEDTVKRHIHLLHEYNEVKDVAMGLIGLVAENRGVTVGVVIREYGVGEEEE
ncbi:Swi5-domain-containing protein [Trichophaea hybrida]|nr:Swi5-domain-containing protein [Trichophaea hybrida]